MDDKLADDFIMEIHHSEENITPLEGGTNYHDTLQKVQVPDETEKGIPMLLKNGT